MSSLNHQINYKGEHMPYTPRQNTHYWMRHSAQRQQRKLIDFCTPYVETGFDSIHIQAELHKQDQHLITLGAIESAISICIGEQQ